MGRFLLGLVANANDGITSKVGTGRFEACSLCNCNISALPGRTTECMRLICVEGGGDARW